mgnify:CR=1 FL=1
MLKINKCPICNGELSYKTKGYVSCPQCHYEFSKKGDAIILDDATPRHIAESFKFIKIVFYDFYKESYSKNVTSVRNSDESDSVACILFFKKN